MAYRNLSDNYIGGNIPAQYSYAADRLSLSSNRLSGVVPRFSPRLQVLEIDYNHLDLCESPFVWLQPAWFVSERCA